MANCIFLCTLLSRLLCLLYATLVYIKIRNQHHDRSITIRFRNRTVATRHQIFCHLIKKKIPGASDGPGSILFLFSAAVKPIFFSGNDQYLITRHFSVIFKIISFAAFFMPVVFKYRPYRLTVISFVAIIPIVSKF